eukprot:TRINITY_DN25842_c0_g1_i1.p1 TRINITY_DN25842_c0_g1~~TRINITY_DN25842_c0_g1_i1.p1  ORF type:complete len:323 (+),score=29.25 TRINITY_DN25842_c0_g1_i1:41-1009(+)
MPAKMKVAAVQMNHKPGDKEYNQAVIQKMSVAAAKDDVSLIAFPEMCITGYWHVRNLSKEDVENLAEPIPGPSTKFLQKLAQEHSLGIGAGLIEKDTTDDKLYNSYVVALPDGSIHVARKLHCFISPHMASGSEYCVFDTPFGWRAAVLICYDNNVVENARCCAVQGAQVLISPHQTGGCTSRSPGVMGAIDVQLWEGRDDKDTAERLKQECKLKGRDWVMRWLPSRAHDNGMFLIFANGVGRDDNEVRTGHAMILDCYGRVLAESDVVQDDMVVATLDQDVLALSSGQRWLSVRRPQLYGALTEETKGGLDTRKGRGGVPQ